MVLTRITFLSAGATLLVACVYSVSADEPTPAPSPIVGADNILIDMDPGAEPGNTATSVGSAEVCARINENNLIDTDEEAEDSVQLDVVYGPEGIDQEHAMIAYSVPMNYPEDQVRVVAEDQHFLLLSGASGELFSVSQSLPDNDGQFVSEALDVLSNTPGNQGDYGPGVLTRIAFESLGGSDPGVYPLSLGSSGPRGQFGGDTDRPPYHVNLLAEAVYASNVVDTDADGFPDTGAQQARLAIDAACPIFPPPLITPAPSASPTPTSPGAAVFVNIPTATPTLANLPKTGGDTGQSGSLGWIPLGVLAVAVAVILLGAAGASPRSHI